MKIKIEKICRLILLVLVCSCVPVISFAQEGKFVASVNPAVVGVNGQFQVTFTVSGNDANSIKNFKAPGFGSFAVISGPSQSTNMQWINGNVSASVSYTYILYARQTGKYTIGSATVEYKGNVLKSEPVQVEVTQSPAKQQKNEKSQPAINVGENLFIKAVADKQHIRLGEQITVTYKLYNRLILAEEPQFKYPNSDGFWAEDFDPPKKPQRARETVNGKVMDVYTVKKTALFATQTGNLKIFPLEAACAIQIPNKRRSNDLFDQFFNDPFFQQTQTAKVDIKSNSLTITVDPIPANAPSGYSGAIGRFTFNASVDKKKVKAGDPITLKLTVAGTGNIRLVALPKPSLPADMESYDPKISENINREGGAISGKKTAEYLLIPRNAGERSLEPMQFVYFDLNKNEYVTLRSSKFDFIIEPGKDFTSSGINIAAKEDVRMLGEDIRFLKLSVGDLKRADEQETSEWFIFGFILPPVAFAGTWFYRKRRERIYGDMPKLLFEKAGREATQRLKKARAVLEQGNTESYHAEILKSLTEYLEHKLRTQKSALVMDDAAARLAKNGVKDDVIRSLRNCMERAEFARYAPGSDSRKARKELLEIAADTIDKIEQTFGKKTRK